MNSVRRVPLHSPTRLLRNVPKNRDGASLPTSRARVKLQLVFDEVGSDYINARSVYRGEEEVGLGMRARLGKRMTFFHSPFSSSIAGPPGVPPTFVITQSPLENTVDDFWRSVTVGWSMGCGCVNEMHALSLLGWSGNTACPSWCYSLSLTSVPSSGRREATPPSIPWWWRGHG